MIYWDERLGWKLIFCREEEPTAKEEYRCCECGKEIKIGEKYSYSVGLWRDLARNKQLYVCRTCLECEKDWKEILGVFYKNRVDGACRVRGLLKEAFQDAFDEGFLKKGDRLVKEWLGIEPEEVDVSVLSPEEREDYERQKAVAQMKAHSTPLL